MKFIYPETEELNGQKRTTTFLQTNGLGGYCSLWAGGGVTRCDQGLLVSARRCPDLRITLVHRLRERLKIGEKICFLSSQDFGDQTAPETGILKDFSFCKLPLWQGEVGKVRIEKRCGIGRLENTAAVIYEVYNDSQEDIEMTAEPMVKLAPKEEARQQACPIAFQNGRLTGNGCSLILKTNGVLREAPARWECLSYPEDRKDGRPGRGMAGSCCEITWQIPAGETRRLWLVVSDRDTVLTAEGILKDQADHLQAAADRCGLKDPIARQLAMAADAFICRRDSTEGKTILAGYPLFSDWGRDTMIALRGCCLSARRFEDAESILRTFLKYEKNGLMPNLFPEGGQKPLYNTADAALLLIDSVWQYYQRTGDHRLVRDAFPVMNRILERYCLGTDHGIKMDGDGLIMAGQGMDQVTWMDVRIGDILPTPRHGKPVEINAYWYHALKIMEQLAPKMGKPSEGYGKLAEITKESFLKEFWMPEQGYLKDVISGTKADTQIRCNQIWAVSMSFSMLDEDQGKKVVETVEHHLFTDHGLRSLSPQDPEYHPSYGGDQLQRDLSYHQGTTWVFPLGAFYLAYLKVHGNSREAAAQVRIWLSSMEEMLREGCAGQLPEIYDGDHPSEGKGCFAQAWSVGEMLTVYEALEKIEEAS